MKQALLPSGWVKPRGYANGVAARGTQVYIAGQIGWNEEARFVSREFGPQAAQALRNIVAVLREAGGTPRHIVRMTWYVTDKRAYLASLAEIGAAWRETMGRHYPAMTLVEVTALVEDRAKVEIESTALVPDEAS